VKLILTCEHATNLLPKQYEFLFKDHEDRLETHEGFDIGAFEVYKSLQHLANYSFHYPWSRLLIEVNRSLHHPKLFSSISKQLDKAEKNCLIVDYYQFYRHQIQQEIKSLIKENETVLHLSIHSFTPVLNGKVREADLGILYDPRRKVEKEFANKFRKELSLQIAGIRIRMNYPYKGKSDGFTTSLRKIFPNDYIGIELEINQNITLDPFKLMKLNDDLKKCLGKIL